MKENNNVYAVILAGGSGQRFWPLSRRAKPKQFLPILGEKSLFGETLNRINTLVPSKNIVIVTNKAYKKEISRQSKTLRIPSSNILMEPSGKNTAPAIYWAALKIKKQNPRGIMIVLPSDHLIEKKQRFLSVLKKSIAFAQKDFLVTLGINPTRPETGYGYIKTAKSIDSKKTGFLVSQFTEKPNLTKAKQFVKSKKFFWNSGMFIWKADTICHEFEISLPNIVKLFNNKCAQNQVGIFWSKLPSVSIDYGILEKAKKVAIVPTGNIQWSDLGSWESLWEVFSKNRADNVIKGDVTAINCEGSLILGSEKMIGVVGLKDIVVVDTDDALLICSKNQSQRVKELVVSLEKTKKNIC